LHQAASSLLPSFNRDSATLVVEVHEHRFGAPIEWEQLWASVAVGIFWLKQPKFFEQFQCRFANIVGDRFVTPAVLQEWWMSK
jgi:hypothetical protein